MTIWRNALVLSLCLSGLTDASDWPQFLGLNRTGTSAETGLLKSFPATGPKVLWKTPLGTSMSGVAVVASQALTLFQDDSQQYAVALSTDDGRVLWKTALAPADRKSTRLNSSH